MSLAARTIAFALGALFCHALETLPDPLYAGLSPLLLPLALRAARLAVPAAFCLGIAATVLHAYPVLAARLPADLHGVELTVEGRIAGVPGSGGDRIGFLLDVERLVGAPPGVAVRWRWRGCRLRLGWYRPPPGARLEAGERWRLRVRLRPPRGLRNPGGYDGEHRALRAGLCAVGYLRERPAPERLAAAGPGIDRLRQHLAERLRIQLAGLPAAGILQALAVGLRDGVSAEQRLLMERTGTAHLMAISGLHVGLMAGLGFALGSLLARALPALLTVLPAAHWGALAALAAAAAYAALAGFSVPTQRALVMVAVLLAARLARRKVRAADAFALALLLVLLADPMAVLDTGTWLSFGAAAGLLFALGLRRGHGRRGAVERRLATALRVQAAACLALLPLSVLGFGFQSLSAPLCNLLAVPVTGLAVVPATLLGSALDAAAPEAAGLLLRAAAHLMGVLLEALARIPGSAQVLVPAAAPGMPALLAAAAGAALLLGGGGARAAVAGLALLSPLLLPPPAAPGAGVLWLQVLDVGQGLAVVLRTSRHVLVFDAGPAWGPRAGAGSHVVAPALRRQGVAGIDLLVVSHHHADHAGGAAGLAAALPPRRRLGVGGIPCRAGQRWNWDGYRFEILHPGAAPSRGNDASCVLRVSGPGGTLLLPADVEAGVERRLARRHGEGLRADLLLLSHHGSATSSAPAFLDAVRPRLAIVSSGHRNRFRHPAPAVLSRLRARGVAFLDTACSGALRVVLAPRKPPRVLAWSDDGMRFWHERDLGRHCGRAS